jgi:hypothetical protein
MEAIASLKPMSGFELIDRGWRTTKFGRSAKK